MKEDDNRMPPPRNRRPTSVTQQLTPVQQQTPWDQRMAQQRDRRPVGPAEAAPPTDAQRRRDQTVGMRHKDTGLSFHARTQNSADRRRANVDTHLAARDANTKMGVKDMEEALRSAIRQNLPEIVRKKEGGGGYVLYAPNEKGRKRKKNPKPVGEFPTRAAAKKAELARFPPKGGTQLKRARKEVDRLLKDPKKAQAQDRKDMRARPPKQTAAPKRAPRPQTEALDRVIGKMVAEELRLRQEAIGTGMWKIMVQRYPQLNELMDGWIEHAEQHGSQSAVEMAKDEISANIPKQAQLDVMAFAAIEIANAVGGK